MRQDSTQDDYNNMARKKIKVLMASAEIAPLAKVGGLADVVGSLPPTLKKLKIDVRLVMPLYGVVEAKKYKLKKIYSNLEIPSGLIMIKVNIWEARLPGTTVPVYFIDAPEYFKHKSVYVTGSNAERYLFFSLALLYALPIIKFQPNIIHCHDFHTALIPDIIKTSKLEYIKNLKTLYTIHNLNYQGKSEISVLSTGNLPTDSLTTLTKDAQDGDINFMVQGILNADLINTVSKAYADEITTSFYGVGLDKILKKRKKHLSGIVNGIDTKFFNPKTDKYIKTNYSLSTIKNKQKNKLALQKMLGLWCDEKVPLICLISRLVWQKGLELINEELIKLDAQFVFLGTGQAQYEKQLKILAKKNPMKVSAQIKFDISLAQQLYASSDIFLMPSRFEPCGLGQMIAMRYGTIPVVRATGGLADTVTTNTGFKFTEFSRTALRRTIKKALKIYYEEPKKWQELQKNSMKMDFSWDKSAKEYLKLYKKLIK
jgi:starch synthase